MPGQHKKREEEKKRKEKAEGKRRRREEERERREEGDTPRGRGRPANLGGVQTSELSPYTPAHLSPSGEVDAPSQTSEVPAVAIVPPASIPNHSSGASHQQATHPISSQGCAHSTLGGVLTQEQAQVVSGPRRRSVPPTTSPSSRRGPLSDSHDAVQRYNQLLERMRTNPEPFIEVETHRHEPAYADIPTDHDQGAPDQAADPIPQSQANEQPYAELDIHGRTIRVSYPEGYQRDNPNANLRRLTVVSWMGIANLMVDLHAWYDDHAVWLYLCLIAMHSGRRAAILSPLYTETIRRARAINETFMTARDQSIGILDEPDIIAIPMNMGGNHWVLGIYTRETHTIRYYNTIWAPLRADTRQALIAVVREFYPNRPDPAINIVPRHAYNQQRDSYNCGPHCCLIFERFMMGDSTLIRPLKHVT